MSDKLSIKVTIGNRVYPLTINRNEEELIRKAAARVNDNLRKLEDAYAVRDKQDLLAMTALYFADKSLASESDTEQLSNEAASRLQNVHHQLAEYLSKEE